MLELTFRVSEDEPGKVSHRAAAGKASLIPVTILDQDSRPLAAGVLQPDTDEGMPLFVLHGRANAGIPLTNAALVQYPDGKTAHLSDFHRCPSELSAHYHFQIRR